MNNVMKTALATLGLATATAAIIASTGADPAQAQALPPLPSPYSYVSGLDVECYRPENQAPPLATTLTINHLNPVLREMGIEREKIQVDELQEVCVPVGKNGTYPEPLAHRYIAYTDLACYTAKSDEEIQLPLNLTHLNPVLQEMGLPDEKVVVGRLEQLCTPVEKRGAKVPPYARRLVSHVDLACYAIKDEPANIDLKIHHLNPLLKPLPRHAVQVLDPHQLCVPVAKDDRLPPKEILEVVQWVDLKKYDVEASDAAPLTLELRHLNPRFSGLEPFRVYLPRPSTLGVPVAKNWRFPPSGDDG